MTQVKVKEIINYQEQDRMVNEWLSENNDPHKSQVKVVIRERFYKVFSNRETEYSVNMYNYYFHLLTRVMNYNGNVICSKKSKMRTALNDVGLMEYLNIKKSVFTKFIAESVRKGYIARVRLEKQNMYLVNPAYAMNGMYLDNTIFTLFAKNKAFADFLVSSVKKEGKGLFGVEVIPKKRDDFEDKAERKTK